MEFHSTSFLLFAFVTLLLYFTVPKRFQWWILLAANYVFYAFAGLKYLAFLLFTTLVAYVIARWMQQRIDAEDAYVLAHRDTMEKAERKAFRSSEKKKRLHLLLTGLFLTLGLLAVVKYTGFVLSGVRTIWVSMGNRPFSVPTLLLPLGISFYTFQTVGYLIDVYRKKIKAERNLAKFALFVSFFPQLIQGPLSRFGDLGEQLTSPHAFSGSAFGAGLLRVVWGYFKKIVVADTAMIAVRTLVEQSTAYNGVYVFLLILLYSVQIYGDFTGGIDITIGLSEMMGIRLAENFNRPFASRSTKEYWRRWHITMGAWFTDYVFYPLSVSNSMQRLSKWSRAHLGEQIGKRLPVYFATVVTWFLTGLWHGAGMNFIVWGLLNCLVILVSQELQPLYTRFHKRFPGLAERKGWQIFQCVRTFLLMGWIRSLDCYRDVSKTFYLWGTVFTKWNLPALLAGGWLDLGLSVVDWFVLGGGILLIFAVSQLGKREPLRYRLVKRPAVLCLCICILTVLILLFGSYGIGYDASDFIYGQF
ncbi:MAG: MBOAT family protein [Clostridia bacterium]|nr:MBOAT family protein [Clostridia bacterium]